MMADTPVPPQHPQVPADGVDPNVVLPAAVVRAAAASNAAHAAVYGGPQGATPPPDPQVVVPPNGANGQVVQAAPAAPPAPAVAAPAAQDLPDLNADGTPNWENRFKALKGRYDADNRRFRETQEQYETRMRELTQQVQQPPQRVEQPPPVLVTPQEIADYGQDFLDVVKRAAVEAVLPMMKPIATELGTVKARVETTETETGRQFVQRMHADMDGKVPGWQDLNRDEKFIAWTRQPDIFSGLNRQELLQRAWYAGDSNRVTAFFTSFLAEEAATDPAAAQARQQAMLSAVGHAAPNGAPASTAQPPAPRLTLEALAAPGRARPATMTPPAGKPVWTAAGISQFYLDVSKGLFRGREAERIATEQDLMAAQREGRIEINPRTATHLGSNG